MDRTTTSTATDSTLADSSPAGDSNVLAKAPSRSSVETSDFGGDLDLEQQLQSGILPRTGAGDQVDLQEKNGAPSSAKVGQPLPATLAQDDPESECYSSFATVPVLTLLRFPSRPEELDHAQEAGSPFSVK